MRRTIILAAALAIMLLGFWGTMVIYFDEARLKGLVSGQLSEQFGRRVEIVGALRFSFFPRLHVEAADVIIAGPGDDDERAMLRAQRVRMSLQLLPLLRGEFAPGQMQLSDAVVNLARWRDDARAADSLSAIRSAAQYLSGRSLQLRNISLLLPGDSGRLAGRVLIDQVELERFSLDRAVRFHFRGDLGDPALLESTSISGLLYVPAAPNRPVRLSNMQINGRLAGIDRPVSLAGDLTVSPDEPFRVALAGGRLLVGESQYDLTFNFHGGTLPAADLLLSGPQLDWSAFAAFPRQSIGVDPGWALAEIAARVDLRSQLQFRRLKLGDLVFSNARIDVRSHDAGLAVNLATVFPGGLIEATGVLTHQSPRSLAVDVSLSQADQLFQWFELPPVVNGSGEAKLFLSWPLEGNSGFQLEGRFDLWDGNWRVARANSDLAATEFDHFGGELRVTPGYLELVHFEVNGSDLSGHGWAAADLSAQVLGGEVYYGNVAGRRLALSGLLGQPQLAPVPPASQDEPVVEDEAPGR